MVFDEPRLPGVATPVSRFVTAYNSEGGARDADQLGLNTASGRSAHRELLGALDLWLTEPYGGSVRILVPHKLHNGRSGDRPSAARLASTPPSDCERQRRLVAAVVPRFLEPGLVPGWQSVGLGCSHRPSDAPPRLRLPRNRRDRGTCR